MELVSSKRSHLNLVPGCRLQDETDTVNARFKVEHNIAEELVRERNLQLEVLLAEANQV